MSLLTLFPLFRQWKKIQDFIKLLDSAVMDLVSVRVQ